MRSISISVAAASLLAGLLHTEVASAQEPMAAPASSSVSASAADSGAGGQKQNGFLLGVNLGTGPTLLSGTAATPVSGLALRGGLLVGYKFGRVMAHLGLEYVGADQLTGSNSHFGSVMFWLGATGALWRTADGRVELIGSVRLGPGVSFLTGIASPSPTALMGYELTPGLRYYLHPSVALQAQAGLGGQYYVTTGAGSTSVGAHSLVASLGAILVL